MICQIKNSTKSNASRCWILTSTLFLLVCNNSKAQIGLGGFNAVMTVPTAHTLQDGRVAVGFGFIPKPYTVYGGPDYDNFAYFAAVGFLPGVEISLRATRALDYYLPSIGDRMASVRLRVVPETRWLPALAIGVHDVIAIQGEEGWFNALYAVATKDVHAFKFFSFGATAGYGVDWIKARAHEFNGLFGGLSFGIGGLLFVKGEYDTQRYNFGFGVSAKSLLSANLTFIDGRREHAAFGATLQYRFFRK